MFSHNGGQTQIDKTAQQNWVLARGLVDPTSSFAEQAAMLASTLPTGDPMFTEYGLTQDVSTFRFNEFSVNYRAPIALARLLRAQSLTLAVQGRNLAMHSTYKGKDPDVNTWSSGESIFDSGELPQPRTWQLAMYLQY
jgi:hypothetical protein